MVRTKSLSSLTNRSGWSLCTKWPAFSTTSMSAPGAMLRAISACDTGITASSLPQITHIGIAAVR